MLKLCNALQTYIIKIITPKETAKYTFIRYINNYAKNKISMHSLNYMSNSPNSNISMIKTLIRSLQ
jgi:hypothetical protein